MRGIILQTKPVSQNGRHALFLGQVSHLERAHHIRRCFLEEFNCTMLNYRSLGSKLFKLVFHRRSISKGVPRFCLSFLKQLRSMFSRKVSYVSPVNWNLSTRENQFCFTSVNYCPSFPLPLPPPTLDLLPPNAKHFPLVLQKSIIFFLS